MKVNRDDTILKLKDGGILKIDSSSSYSAGCPTCDFGAEYFDDIDFVLNNYVVFCMATTGYGISIGDVISLFGRNIDNFKDMTELHFINFFKHFILTKDKNASIRAYNIKIQDDGTVVRLDEVNI